MTRAGKPMSKAEVKAKADRAEGLVRETPAGQVVRKVGRPSEYRPELGDELIDIMARGYSLTAASAMLGFHRETALNWAERYPEFFDALKLAKGKRVAALETGLLEFGGSQDGPRVTARIFALKNADPVEWRERIEHTGANGGALQVEMTDQDRVKAIALIMARARMEAEAKTIEGTAVEISKDGQKQG